MLFSKTLSVKSDRPILDLWGVGDKDIFLSFDLNKSFKLLKIRTFLLNFF